MGTVRNMPVAKDGAGLIDNLGKSRSIIQNLGFLVGGRVLGDAITFVMFVVLSRAYGQEGIGEYSFAIGFTGFFAVPASFGLYHLTIKRLTQSQNSFSNDYGRIISLHFILSVIGFVALLLIVMLSSFSVETKLIIVLIGAFQLMSNLVIGLTAARIAKEDMHLAGLFDASLKAVAALLASVVIILGGSLPVALAVLPVVTGVQLIVAYRFVSKRYGDPRLTVSPSSLIALIREALPYAQSTILAQISTRLDVVLLTFMLGASAAGLYNVGYRAVFMFLFVPRISATSILPRASKLYGESKAELSEFYHKSLNSTILVGLPITAGLWMVAPDTISFIFGKEFSEAASVLRLLAGLLILAFLSQTMGVFLIACDRQATRTKGHWIAAITNVIANLILIPTLGVQGAAIAALISASSQTVFYLVRLGPVLGWPRPSFRLGISSLGVASFLIPFTLLPSVPLGAVIPASALAYLMILMLFRETRRNEVRMLFSLLRR